MLHRYPLRAVLVVAAAWLLFTFSVLVYACVSLLLLPFLPAIVFGQISLLSSAHEYARSVARAAPELVAQRRALAVPSTPA